MVEPANHDFPCPAWKIAIGSLSASALATGSTSCSSLFRHVPTFATSQVSTESPGFGNWSDRFRDLAGLARNVATNMSSGFSTIELLSPPPVTVMGALNAVSTTEETLNPSGVFISGVFSFVVVASSASATYSAVTAPFRVAAPNSFTTFIVTIEDVSASPAILL